MTHLGQRAVDQLPYRGSFGDPRPPGLAGVALPPAAMPARDGLRPLKKWRYVGIYGPELMLCIGAVRIGRAHQAFWALWDRRTRELYERTSIGRGSVALAYGYARVSEPPLEIELELAETAGIETVCRTGDSYAWTRKQGGIAAHATISIAGSRRQLEGRAVIDDTAAYYERHTHWRWSAGVGTTNDGRAAAWNLVQGVNDPPRDSERTIWIDGRHTEAPRADFAADLTAVNDLRFVAEAVRERRDNLLVLRSSYRQPFGTFSGELAPGLALAEGYGVMEEHDARW